MHPRTNLLALSLAALTSLAACAGGDNTPTGPATGSVTISTSTTGTDHDPDGYVVGIVGRTPRDIGINSSVSLLEVPVGTHSVELTGLAVNCTVAGSPRSVTVTRNQATEVAFAVTCTPNQGSVAVSVTTTGSDPDSDGYTVALGAATPQPITESLTLTTVPVGQQTITLSGVAANCTVAEGNTRSVAVAFNATVSAAFTVTCVANTGTVAVTTTTTGGNIDPDGYSLTVDTASTRPIGTSATVTVSGVRTGSRTVELTGVASNCTVAGGNSRIVVVSFDSTSTVDFSISCIATGTIEVRTTTTGVDINHNGYGFSIEGAPATSIGIDGVIAVTDIPTGSRTVTLSGLASNCTATDGPVRTVTVGQGMTVVAAFDITCSAQMIAFARFVDGSYDIHTMRTDGSNVVRLTTDAAADENPAWSPDGSRIAFQSHPTGQVDIYVMNADGSNVQRLTTAAGSDAYPSWSPDGSRIAFASNRDGNMEIYVMNADGSGQTRLTNSVGNDDQPSFSPDGTKIVFRSSRDGNLEIYSMNSDGTGTTRLTNANLSSESAPSFSNDGSRILFSSNRNGSQEIFVMNADGSAPTQLTALGSTNTYPHFSRDDRRIIFTSWSSGVAGTYVMNADGSSVVRLSPAASSDVTPVFRP